jgi:hypothetical protein
MRLLCTALAIAAMLLAPTTTIGAPPAKAKAADGGTAPAITKAARVQFRRQFLRGRKLSAQKRWGEAVVAFEAALQAVPMNEQALTDLGWAAFQAGDLAKARAADQNAVRATTQPALRAAALYNLGRVEEAQGDRSAAARSYQQSLALRSHPAVEARLAAFGEARTPARPESPLSVRLSGCWAKGALTLEAVCACLAREEVDDQELKQQPASELCQVTTAEKLPDTMRVATLQTSTTNEATDFLVVREGKGWRVMVPLGGTYNPGIAGISEELAVTAVSQGKVGGRAYVRIETSHHRYDSDMGIDEAESSGTASVMLLFPARKPEERPVAVQFPVRYRYERYRLETEEVDDPELRAMQTKGLPISEETVLDAKLGDDGKLRIRLVRGKADGEMREILGEHALPLR